MSISRLISWIIALASAIAAFVIMNNLKSKVTGDQPDQSPLTSQEKTYVFITCFFSPLLAQAVYYYGWKKKLPVKAKSANNLGWVAILVLIVFWVGIGALVGALGG
ncbi:MAG: hypothetical protein B7X04_03825 [Parcubacteria group bacterium 21-54-25]|nr:MAG: hypothetical protein B7X04_03825 [Parcubacteria group bacterium 21-54-25]HQU08195.1 hypothetical protein [Candidatus Paceibacterota bacterium]